MITALQTLGSYKKGDIIPEDAFDESMLNCFVKYKLVSISKPKKVTTKKKAKKKEAE